MTRIAAVAVREARQFSRDHLTLAIAALLPIVLMTLYGTALNSNIRNLRLMVEDLDNTPASRRYIDAYAATNKFILVPHAAGESAETALDRGYARGSLRIPPGFARDLANGRSPTVQLLVDGTETNAATVLRGMSAAIAQSFDAPRQSPPLSLRVRHWYNHGLSDRLFFGSGALGLVLILFPSLLGGLSASREMELGTVTQAYAAGVTATEWVVGKAIPHIATGLIQFVVCFTLGRFIFGYSLPDHPAPFLASVFVYICAAVFYGMLVGHATGNQSAAIQAVQFGAFMFSLLLSGFITPLSNAPVAMQAISNIVPARHFVEITRDIMLRGGDWSTSGESILKLSGLALFFFAANIGRMRRMRFDA